ncbi:hypothetical protein FB446DRAFT_703827 [Lentinula raphanica]|nr:hypothetical protein FB446DRAFT_703827 [Lentinula raphanica]
MSSSSSVSSSELSERSRAGSSSAVIEGPPLELSLFRQLERVRYLLTVENQSQTEIDTDSSLPWLILVCVFVWGERGGVWEGGVYEDGKEEGQGESNGDGDAQCNGSTGKSKDQEEKVEIENKPGKTNHDHYPDPYPKHKHKLNPICLQYQRTPMTTTTSSIAFWTASTALFLTSREHTATSTTEMNPYRRQQTTIRHTTTTHDAQDNDSNTATEMNPYRRQQTTIRHTTTTHRHTTTTHDAQDNDSNTARELRETTMNNDDHEEYNIYDLLVIHHCLDTRYDYNYRHTNYNYRHTD